jgi:hypothetical protein
MITYPRAPAELFPPWEAAQREARELAREPLPAASDLRRTGFLEPDLAERISDWFSGEATAPAAAVRAAYAALERETDRLACVIRCGLGVRVRYTYGEADPYDSAAELCADLRRHGAMKLRTGDRHPLLSTRSLDRLRVAHDVLGHAALGLGFDLQSEYATWLQCRALFSPRARPAAFTELVGAVTAHVLTGAKPALRADLPPLDLYTG